MKKIGCIMVMLCMACVLFGQNNPPRLTEEKKREFEAQKVAFITRELKLTPEEAAKFWPLYNEMLQKVREVRGPRKEREEASGMTEKQAQQQIDFIIASAEKEVAIKKEYYKRIVEVISAKRLLLLFEAEYNFHHQLWKKLGEEHPRETR